MSGEPLQTPLEVMRAHVGVYWAWWDDLTNDPDNKRDQYAQMDAQLTRAAKWAVIAIAEALAPKDES